MPSRNFSLMIVDEDIHVRECLSEIFHSAGYDVSMAECPESALQQLSQDSLLPNVFILGKASDSGLIRALLNRPREERLDHEDPPSLIVFPSFRVAFGSPAEGGTRLVHACRLRMVSNLLTLVRELARPWLAKAGTA